MSYLRHTIATFFLFSTIDALAIQPAQLIDNPSLSLALPLQFSTVPSAPQNTAFPQANTTYNSTIHDFDHDSRTECNAKYYGVPAISSCLEVYRQMTDSDKLVEFGDRSRGVFDYALPYRLTSGQKTFYDS